MSENNNTTQPPMTIEQRLLRIEAILVISTKNVLSTSEAAMMLGVTSDYLRHLVCQRAIPHYKKGRNTYFKKSEIESWQLERKVPTFDELSAKGATYAAINRR